MTREERRETRIIRCPACQRYYRIAAGPPSPNARLRCSKCGEIFSLSAAVAATPQAPATPQPKRGRVLVSTDGEEFQALIGEVLTAAGFTLRQARSGEEAWAAIGSWRPRVALLDVALPGIPAFELCDRVRADRDLKGTGLILIASVFQQTRYKRAPTSLYGADDYIEKHHIRDWLPEKIERLMHAGAAVAEPAAALEAAAPSKAGKAGKAVAAPTPAEVRHGGADGHDEQDEHDQESLIREELYGPPGRERQGLQRLQEGLRRYARIIISDIALYNQELVERGIREGTFTTLLKKEIEEGSRLYQLRVPSSSGGKGITTRRSGTSSPSARRRRSPTCARRGGGSEPPRGVARAARLPGRGGPPRGGSGAARRRAGGASPTDRGAR